MEPVRRDRDPEQVAVADFAIREQAQPLTDPMRPMDRIRTGDFRMQGVPMEERSMGGILTVRVSE